MQLANGIYHHGKNENEKTMDNEQTFYSGKIISLIWSEKILFTDFETINFRDCLCATAFVSFICTCVYESVRVGSIILCSPFDVVSYALSYRFSISRECYAVALTLKAADRLCSVSNWNVQQHSMRFREDIFCQLVDAQQWHISLWFILPLCVRELIDERRFCGKWNGAECGTSSYSIYYIGIVHIKHTST